MRRYTTLFCMVAALLSSVMAGRLIAVQVADSGLEGLKQEMSDMPGAVAAEGGAQPAPVIEELAPAAEAPKKEEPAPAEAAPAKEAPAATAPVIEELAPATAPATEASKKEESAPAAAEAAPAKEEPAPAKEQAAMPELAPAAAPAAETAPAAPAVAAVAEPDAATRQALEAQMKELGSADRIKIGTSVAQQEEVRRKVRELEGQKALEAADRAWSDRDYAAAAEQYKMALARIPNVPKCRAMRDRAAQRIPDAEYEIVLALAKDGSKDDVALATADEFLKQRPSPKLKALASKLREKQEKLATKKAPVAEETVKGETEVEKQMRLGKTYMAGREYAKSRACFESVLGLDPDHREAMRYLKVLGEREYGNKSVERDSTVKKMTAEVRDAWNPKYKVIKGREVASEKKATEKPGESRIEEKMKKITIDEIEFRQANMHDVVDFLNKRSHDMDKTTDDPTKRGVNIILNLGPGTAGAAAPAAKPAEDVFAPEAGQPAAAGATGVPEVTFSARYITLFNALKIITDVAGLKWRVDGDVVMIVPRDWTPDKMEMRMYPVEPTFIERVKTASTEMPGTQTIGGREVKELGGGGGVAETLPTDLKAYFENMGVKFPKGSSVNYSQAIGKVIVLNTEDNLSAFEKILAELNVVPKQVEIEARFVEVNETDLYEAGLEWLLTDNWEMLVKNSSSAYAPASSTPRIQMNGNDGSGGVTKGLRFYGLSDTDQPMLKGAGKGTLGNIASFASVLTNPDLTLVLHALEQNGNADLLSAPKVTTRSGSEATIKVVTEYIYPTSFEVQGGQFNNNNTTASSSIVQETTVVPQDFATREVGVILNVMPEVSPDGNMINLTMKPQVVTEPTWYQYGSKVRRADGSELQMNMPQPFFHVRTLETQISIYDGATVVMGGLITESVEKANDKIPILGDIPFIGALFRSKSENSIKKNLLIFVTAKLVDPAGHLIRAQEDTAKPGSVPVAAGAAAAAK